MTWALVTLGVMLLLFSTGVTLASDLAWPLTRSLSWATALPFLGIGGLIASRHPANAIGWIFLGVGVATGFGEATHAYAEYWVSGAGSEALGKAAAWYSNVSWIPFILVPASFLLLLFPDGHLLSARWRPIAWCAALAIGGVFVTTAVTPGPLEDFPKVANPFGWTSPLLDPLTAAAFILLLLAVVGSAVSLILRFRSAVGVQRLQMKWLAFAGAVAGVTIPIAVIGYSVWGETISNVAIMMSLLALPIAAGMAILRFRLYDIDVIVNRTLVYGALTALLAGFYYGAVVVLQGVLKPITAESDIAIAASTLAVAAVFRPLRSRVQGFIDRRFYRRKYDAAETLEGFSARLRDQVDLDSLKGKLVGVVGETMQPSHVSLWLRGTDYGS